MRFPDGQYTRNCPPPVSTAQASRTTRRKLRQQHRLSGAISVGHLGPLQFPPGNLTRARRLLGLQSVQVHIGDSARVQVRDTRVCRALPGRRDYGVHVRKSGAVKPRGVLVIDVSAAFDAANGAAQMPTFCLVVMCASTSPNSYQSDGFKRVATGEVDYILDVMAVRVFFQMPVTKLSRP